MIIYYIHTRRFFKDVKNFGIVVVNVVCISHFVGFSSFKNSMSVWVSLLSKFIKDRFVCVWVKVMWIVQVSIVNGSYKCLTWIKKLVFINIVYFFLLIFITVENLWWQKSFCSLTVPITNNSNPASQSFSFNKIKSSLLFIIIWSPLLYSLLILNQY